MTELEYINKLNFLHRELNDTEKERDKKIHELRTKKTNEIASLNVQKCKLVPHWWNKDAQRIVEIENKIMEVKNFYEYQISESWHFYKDRITTLSDQIARLRYERFHDAKQIAEETKAVDNVVCESEMKEETEVIYANPKF